MADNKTVDNNALTDYPVATDEVTYSGDTADIQVVRPSHVTGTEGAKTAEAITQTTGSAVPPAVMFVGGTDGTNARALKLDASGEAQVDVLTLPNVTIGAALPAGANNIGDVDVLTLPSIPAGTNNIGDVDVLSLPALPAGANNIGTVTLNSDAITGAAVPSRAQYAAGTDGTNARGLKTDADGELQVDVLTLPNVTIGAAIPAGANNIGDVDVLTLPSIPAGTNNIGDVDVLTLPALPAGGNKIGAVDLDSDAATGAAVPAVAQFVAGTDGTNARALKTDASGELQIDVLTLPNVTIGAAIPAGTNNIGDVDVLTLPSIPAGTNNIGDVDVLTLPALPAGTNNIGDVDVLTMPNVTLAAGTNTNEVVGDVAHSAGVAGNPILVCGVSQDTDDTAPPNRVDAESDATRLATDYDGALYVRPHGPQVWSYHLNTSTAQTDTTVHAAPGAGLSLYVGTIVFSSGSATAINLFFEEGASTILGPYYLEAVAGRGMAIQFNPPRKITANTALTLTTSASIAHCVDVTGFTAND